MESRRRVQKEEGEEEDEEEEDKEEEEEYGGGRREEEEDAVVSARTRARRPAPGCLPRAARACGPSMASFQDAIVRKWLLEMVGARAFVAARRAFIAEVVAARRAAGAAEGPPLEDSRTTTS